MLKNKLIKLYLFIPGEANTFFQMTGRKKYDKIGIYKYQKKRSA